MEQPRIQAFADATEDQQWIHTDPARAYARKQMAELEEQVLQKIALMEEVSGEITAAASSLGELEQNSEQRRSEKQVEIDKVQLDIDSDNARREEIRTARMEGEVEDTAEVERSRIALVVHIRQKLLAFPAKSASSAFSSSKRFCVFARRSSRKFCAVAPLCAMRS